MRNGTDVSREPSHSESHPRVTFSDCVVCVNGMALLFGFMKLRLQGGSNSSRLVGDDLRSGLAWVKPSMPAYTALGSRLSMRSSWLYLAVRSDRLGRRS